jgi:hypothetical protein
MRARRASLPRMAGSCVSVKARHTELAGAAAKERKVKLLFWLEGSPMRPLAAVRTAIAEGIGVFSAGDLRASSECMQNGCLCEGG